jgi:hypothetical protein
MNAVTAAAGRVAMIVLAGLGLGIVVGGVIGRLAMYALARLNPDATGVVSDDGFVMGQFTLSGTLNLLLVGGFLGAFGGVVYAAARHLTFGPGWWRVLSVALGAGLPVGALIVHTDGVDFTLLEPAELAVALFVLIPALYGVLLTALVERHVAPPPASWGRLEALRWVLRAGATAVIAGALLNLADDLSVLA